MGYTLGVALSAQLKKTPYLLSELPYPEPKVERCHVPVSRFVMGIVLRLETHNRFSGA